MYSSRKLKRYRKGVTDWCNYRFGRPEDAVTVFVHIPKTAGTSMTDTLRANRNLLRLVQGVLAGRKDLDGRGKTLFSADEDAVVLREEIIRRKDEIDTITGHIPFGVHRLLERPCHYFTLLREPMARAQSQFAHALRRPDDSVLGGIVKSCDGDIVKSIEEQTALQFMNDQTRMIIGSDKIQLTESDLELAKSLLIERYAVFGTLEALDESLRRIVSRLGWQHIDFRHLNAAPTAGARQQFSTKENAMLRESNQLDLKLYAWVQQRLSGVPRR